ncbi:MAG: biotin/lipoyl-binding protein, partial [Bacteroidales bacterium]|nr:biotin/lipoyl-binding protein [Bacteroidales bacterium]
MNKTSKRILTIVIVLFLAGVIAYPKIKPLLNKSFPKAGSENTKSTVSHKVLNVSGYLIKPQALSEYVRATGTLRPDEEVDLSFETSGKIISIKFTEGTRVKKGDLLAKINDKPLQAQLQKLEAQKKLSEAKEFRQRTLLDKDAISQESYDQIVTELQTIEADINLIKARISETELRAPF